MAKNLLSLLGIFALLFISINLASASFVAYDTSYPSSVLHNDGSFTITFTLGNTGSLETLNWSASSVSGANANMTLPSQTSINANENLSISVPVVFDSYKTGTISGSIIAQGNVSSVTIPFSVSINQTISLTITDPSILTQSGISSFTITNTGNTPVTPSVAVQSISYGTTTLDFTITSIGTITAGNSKVVNISAAVPNSFPLAGESTSVNISGSNFDTVQKTLNIEKSYCESGTAGSIIEIKDFNDKSSGDEWEWAPLEDIEVSVKIKNNGDSKEKVIVNLGLYNLDENEFIEIDGEDELEDSVRIGEGDTETFTFKFKVPADIEKSDDYRLYVKAYVDDNETGECQVEYESIDVEFDSEIAVDELEIPSFLCGYSDVVSFRLYNFELGDEEEIRVNLYNKELGIDLFSDQFKLDEMDYEDLSFELSIPEDAEEKNYNIDLIVEYDYKDSTETYRSSNDDNDFSIIVAGSCLQAEPAISASLNSNAKVGDELMITFSLTNPAKDTEFTVIPTGYEEWAELIEPATGSQKINISKGSTKEITVKLKPTESGSKNFNIDVIYNGQTTSQQLAVEIEGRSLMGSISEFSILGLSGTILWLSIGIAFILMVLVIALIVKSAGKTQGI